MKITILQGAFLPVPARMGGAVEKMWFLLGQKFASRGHEVVQVSKRFRDLPKKEMIEGVEHRRVSGFNIPKNLAILKLLDGIYTLMAIRSIPVDAELIVTNTFWAPLVLPLFRKGKIYVDVARMPKGQMRYYNHAACLRANSTPVAVAIKAELPKDRYNQVAMIPNPLPYDPDVPVNFEEKKPSILFCGRIHPEKGLELLLETSKRLPQGWRLTIIGPWKTSEGGGGEVYYNKLKSMFDASKVAFIEPIYEIDKLNSLYKQAEIFVYPSVAEKGETFGLAPLEAMAWGCVPVVSDIACFKDFITDNVNGMIFNHRAKDAGEQLMNDLLALISQERLRRELGENALKVRKTHSSDVIADLFLADFERLVA
ncbi:MAG: glycosyltransferase family 4 protein [Methylophilaceae bacterium]